MNQNDVLKIIKKAILDKKGERVEIIDVKHLTPFADFYVICSASNFRQIDAIKDSVIFALEKEGVKIGHSEGKSTSGWILIDAYQYVINIFSKEARKNFDLETLLKRK